nr:protein argonaute 4-like [Tanacetum cinerariifolium]
MKFNINQRHSGWKDLKIHHRKNTGEHRHMGSRSVWKTLRKLSDIEIDFEAINSQEALRVLDILLRQHATRQGCLLVRQSFFHKDVKNFAHVGGRVVVADFIQVYVPLKADSL